MNGKPPHDILLENLIDSVRDLTDARLQRRLWLVRGGPEVSSFVEMWCQTFDDTGLSDAIDENRCPANLTQDAFEALKELDAAMKRVDYEQPPERVLHDPKMEEARQSAARALEILLGMPARESEQS